MAITELIARDSSPCERCGRVEDLIGEYPDGPLLCRQCRGIYTCNCCGWPFVEGEANPETYVCEFCQDRCQYDVEGSECVLPYAKRVGECRCPSRTGPILRFCPNCGACNHTNLGSLDQLEEHSVLRCDDCDQDVEVQTYNVVLPPC